jgi:choline dehydrogenase-like flavoprotein
MTTNVLSDVDANSFDYVIVGGGTAGCVIASRLAEYLPHKRTLLVEAGPSDFLNDEILNLKDWLKLLGGEYDYGYRTTEQKMGEHTAERESTVRRRPRVRDRVPRAPTCIVIVRARWCLGSPS